MDGQQFDQYVQALGRAVGRRGVLAGLGGLVAAGISEVAAKNKHKNQHRKRKGDKAHQQKGSDPSCYQEHKIGWCHCQPQKHCNVICIDTNSTLPPVGHDPQSHPDDYECAVDTPCFTAAEGDSCPRLCGLHTQRFSQGFEKNTAGWFPFGTSGPLQRVASGTDGIAAASGKWFAESPQFVAPNDGNPPGSNFTRWGSYGNVFPSGGYTTELAIYLNPAGGYADDTRFDYTSAINDPTCTFRRDFVFNVGYYTGTATCGVGGTGSRYVISATTNSYRANEFPCDVTKDPIVITTAGWYTFRHVFYDAGDGTLAVDLILLDASGTTEIHKWTLNDKTDVIGTTVGGNRYGWLPNQEFPFLAIDNSSYVAG